MGDPRLWLGARRIEAEVWKRMAVTLAAKADRPGAEPGAPPCTRSPAPGAAGRSLLRILVASECRSGPPSDLTPSSGDPVAGE